MAKILIVDDEERLRTALSVTLEGEGYDVVEAESAEDALELLDGGLEPNVVLTDNRMSGMDGLELLKNITIHYPSVDTIVMTAFGSSSLGAEAFQNGALEFLSKPFEMNELLTHIKSAVKKQTMIKAATAAKSQTEVVESSGAFKQVIGTSMVMLNVQELCSMAAPRDTTILVRGPSGSGKELVARAIHAESGRDTFVAINCGAIAPNLLESELFGHEKGAFTGAHAIKEGCFENAGTGTLFLDEIGDVSLDMQVKLLRVLQEREFTRVGGTTPIKLNARILAATHKNLENMIGDGSFREDLYFRLNIFPITIPPLKERAEDIPLLVEFFLKKFNHTSGINSTALSQLTAYHWPGNIRELENAIERAVILARGSSIKSGHLPAFAASSVSTSQIESRSSSPSAEGTSLIESEKQMILDAIKTAGGNKAKAARILGITRRVLYSKIKSHKLDL